MHGGMLGHFMCMHGTVMGHVMCMAMRLETSSHVHGHVENVMPSISTIHTVYIIITMPCHANK